MERDIGQSLTLKGTSLDSLSRVERFNHLIVGELLGPNPCNEEIHLIEQWLPSLRTTPLKTTLKIPLSIVNISCHHVGVIAVPLSIPLGVNLSPI